MLIPRISAVARLLHGTPESVAGRSRTWSLLTLNERSFMEVIYESESSHDT